MKKSKSLLTFLESCVMIPKRKNPIKSKKDKTMPYQKNQILEVDIVDMNMMGFGVAKMDGAVIFVQNAVTGDRAKIRIIKCAKNYDVARIEELLISSPKRREVECPAFRRCGGCAFQHIDYVYEKELKEQFVKSCFVKQGLPHIQVLPVLSTEEKKHYRNKAQFPVAKDAYGRVYAGFYSPKTHTVCQVDFCLIQAPIFYEISNAVCRYLTEEGIEPYCEEMHSGLVRHIFLRRGEKSGEVMLCLVLREDKFPKEQHFVSHITKKFPEIASVVWNIQTDKTNVILGKQSRVLYGKSKIKDILLNKEFEISPQAFYQVNHNGAELLYQTAFSMAKVENFDLILDLYCGIGTISLTAPTAAPIVGIEIVPEAVEDAKTNAKLNHVNNADFICADAKDAFQLIKERNAKKPLLVVDPPRKGLSPQLIEDIIRSDVKDILYISCAPDTLARDIALLIKAGFTCSPVQPVEMFPRTSHVETVALLSRQKVDEHIYLDVNVQDLPKTTRTTATYPEIKAYVKDKYGLNVTSLNIAQVKKKHGFEKRENYNKGKDGHRVPNCPPEKEKAIEDAFKHFGML